VSCDLYTQSNHYMYTMYYIYNVYCDLKSRQKIVLYYSILKILIPIPTQELPITFRDKDYSHTLNAVAFKLQSVWAIWKLIEIEITLRNT